MSLLDSRLLGYEDAVAWTTSLSPRGIHEVLLLNSQPYLLVNERYTGVIHCYDRRAMDSPMYSIQRISNTQQVCI